MTVISREQLRCQPFRACPFTILDSFRFKYPVQGKTLLNAILPGSLLGMGQQTSGNEDDEGQFVHRAVRFDTTGRGESLRTAANSRFRLVSLSF